MLLPRLRLRPPAASTMLAASMRGGAPGELRPLVSPWSPSSSRTSHGSRSAIMRCWADGRGRGGRASSSSSSSTTTAAKRADSAQFTATSRSKPPSSSSSSSSSRRAALPEMTTSSQIGYAMAGGLLITVAGGVAYLHDHLGGPDGLARSASFYSVAIPRYVEYRLLMVGGSDDDEEAWEELHRRASQNGLDKIRDLGGFYIKTGQMAANNIGNAFPKIWQDTMSVLQDQCPHKDFDTVRAIVESELGKSLEEAFASFEETPIGAASIGQVHRAVLPNGDRVVVKVMYPEVETLFRGDVRTLKMFCQLAQPVHVPALEMVEKHFLTEFDYKKEAMQQETIRRNLIQAGFAGNVDSPCAVPRTYLDLCTRRVLVMEELRGEKLADGLRRDMERHAARAGITPEQLRAEEEQKDLEARAMGVLRKGPTSDEFDRYIAVLDAGRRASNVGARLYNAGVAWWLPGSRRRPVLDRTTLPLNHAKIVDDLIRIFGYQVLVDGYFSGDPHPGNILLLGVEEGHPQLGLIDYGQVGQLSKKARLLFCRLTIALADDDKPEIVRLMKEAGFKSKNMKEEVIYKYGKVYYDEDNPDLTGGLHIQVFVENLEKIDPILQIPEDFIMIGRASIMLRGLAHALHQSRSLAKAWRPIAVDVLKNEGGLVENSKD